MVTAQAFGQGVALEASVPDDKVLGSADVTELVPAESLQVAPGGDPLPSHQLISHDLGVASFFSNFQALVDEMSSRLRLQGASVPEGALSLARWNPVLLQRRVSDLEAANADMTRQYSALEEKRSQDQAELVRRCSDLEEKYSQSQTELAQVSASLNDANTLNSILHAQLDSEKEEKHALVTSRDNLDRLYRDSSNSLTIFERSHRFTREELDNLRYKLQESLDDVIRLRELISAKDVVIKNLRASKKSVAQELEAAQLAIKVAEETSATLRAQRDKAMDKAIRAGRILMRRPGVVVPDDIVADVNAAPDSSSRPSSSVAPEKDVAG
ncbi:uncharacterized protein [Zea mays]|uniref:uncharacterized protein n=1 Tax=Zea mays TaxID=4577 RepID=UPI0009AA400B|nr:uncharacterized protein LOC109941715 [Zea mays]|eukprot:XP_020398512.1 uncharacterized protein LOC109941715 [Zea mays]